ncbi:IclR family transcriptional regulator [Paraburkholderia bryophila]|jgi:DNA-binding IclR family transcriptional regulator|uniref:IclR family transcriptional regulator n=1 Tax=Paraburkholderia bryophila TaxID=420952 RepID=A0A329BNH9_9BURK|nr:IclR family transcriptional regulator [Paraburkholderia bryophila]RAS20504.1 IclR family transcriptional regulator [Paraburkholderia bryophila]
MPPTARSGAIRNDQGTTEPLDAASELTDIDEESGETGDGGEEKLRSGIQSIEVGFRLLDVLTHETRAMMLRDLAQRAGMSPAKAHRYLVSFLRLGVVSQDPLSGRYELGGFALQLGLARLARVDGVKLARIALAELRDRLDLTVGIAVWGNQGPTMVHWMESSHPAKASLKLGDVMPLLSSATGLLFAAYLPVSKTAAMLERELADARRAAHLGGPRTRDEVEQTLAQVRQHQAARVEGMLLPTIHAFCMPVFDSTGDLALGLIALGHEGVFDIRWGGEIDLALRDCAQKLSYELGYSATPRDARN